MHCPSCGTAASGPDQRFCAKCGTNLAAVEPPTAYGQAPRITGPLFADDPPPPPSTPPPSAPPPAPPTFAVPSGPPPAAAPPPASPYDERRRRRRTPFVLLAVAALVAALIGAGGVVLLFGDDEDPAADTTAEDRRDDADATTDPGSTAPTTAPESSASQTTEPPTFQCWDGGTVTRLASCTPPTGAAGLAWVFPSATDPTCSANAGVQRATEADCAPVVGGETVRFHYSEWRDRAALETYYRGNTLEEIAAPSGRDDLAAALVDSRDSDVGYKVAIYYSDTEALWSVTIYAADEAQYLAAVDQLEMLPFRQLRGKRA